MSIATLLAQHNHVTAVDVIQEKVEKTNNSILQFTMKKLFLSFILFLFYLPVGAIHPVLTKPTLKVLDIGNSYTTDATAMLRQVTEASGSDISNICLYKADRSGGSLKDWCNVYNDKDTKTYSISKVMGGLNANIKTGSGAIGDGTLFRDALSSEQWDLIIIHQVSSSAPYYSNWSGVNSDGSLQELLSIIKKHQPNAEIGFYIVHSYWTGYGANKERSSYERWKLIADGVKNVMKNYDIDFIIPYGTAVQNLRLTSLNNDYDLTRDGTHLGVGLCRYAAACCYYETLVAPRSGISVIGNTYRNSAKDLSVTSKYPIIEVTDNNADIAQKAATLAVLSPFECMNPETANRITPKRGDVNEDGEVGMPDVMYLVNYILNGKFPE